MTATFTTGISDTLANLLDTAGTAINANVTAAASDHGAIAINISDNSTSITAAKLSLITAATGGAVTFSNSQTITGKGAQVKAALVTDAVTASGGTTATVSGTINAADASAIAAANNVAATFSNGVTDSLSAFASTGSGSDELGNIVGDHDSVDITISDDAGLSLIHI